MSCERHREGLTDLAAGRTDAGEPAARALEAAAHATGCPACRQELEALRRAIGLADGELRRLGRAEPSPELRARIRRAVADSGPLRTAPSVRWSWALSLAAAVLVVALAAARRGGWFEPSPSPAAAAAAPSVPGIGRHVEPASPVPAAGTRPPADHATPRAGAGMASERTRTVSRRHAGGPDVLVPAGQEEALLRFVALVHERQLHPTALLAAGQPPADLPLPADIAIQPLEIVPLDPAENPGT